MAEFRSQERTSYYKDRAGLWGDLRDYELMLTRERAKRMSRPFADEAWETHRREWFPSGWGQP